MRIPNLILAAYIDGKWQETTYTTDDPSWKESLKILKSASIPVKIIYPPKEIN
jgi:hypothetical protein